jgi:hypothetical protein
MVLRISQLRPRFLQLYDRFEKQAERIANEQLPAVSCKRKEVLRMTMVDYQKWAGVTGATRSRFPSLKFSSCTPKARSTST